MTPPVGVVRRDRWGVPHLLADDVLDLARLQGWAVARDRARQIELDRLHVVGRTAEVLGRTAVAWDVLARRARVADLAERAFAALDEETRRWCSAFVDGVVEGLGDDTLPGRWQPWTPLGIFAVNHLLFSTFPTKLWRAHVRDRLGRAAVDAFVGEAAVHSGSNAWVAGGGRTASGLPLIAGDPHRLMESPGVYQQVRLTCPELDVIGLTFPGVPGAQHFGHAGRVAWAVTHAMADYQDLLVETLRRGPDGVEARGPSGWEPVDVRHETVEVLAGDPVGIEVLTTARGPVISEASGDEPVHSLRTPAWELADLGFGALLPLLRSRTAADVERALDAWVEPVNHVVVADATGEVRHRVAGRVPVRSAEARVLPVPADDPTTTWTGWVDLPREVVDPDAVVVSANQRRGPGWERIGHEFAPPVRAERIAALLAGHRALTVEDAARIHGDTAAPTARALVDRALAADVPEAADLVERLRTWDETMDADSKGAAVLGALRSALVLVLAEHPALAPLAPTPDGLYAPWLDLRGRLALVLDRWLREGAPFGIDLDAAVAAALARLAAGPAPTTWGDAHVWRPPGAPEVRLSGDTDCVLSTTSIPGLDLVVRGPVARFVWDLADRERSRWVVPLGADGALDAPHHHDQLDAWAAGVLLPVVGPRTTGDAR